MTEADMVEVSTQRFATGGDAVGRLDDGMVVFVAGAAPGERVLARINQRHKRHARASLLEVLEQAPMRRDIACDHARTGECGGCDWAFVDGPSQVESKIALVTEQLQRYGAIAEPVVGRVRRPHDQPRAHQAGLEAKLAGRTTVRCLVTEGRAGFRAKRSHRGFVADSCGAAHPLIEELIVDARFPGASEVVLRAGAATGERLAIVDGPTDRVRVPDDVNVVALAESMGAAYHEEVNGVRLRVSANSFFQSSHYGATLLAGEVARHVPEGARLADLYAGVGMLAATTAAQRGGLVNVAVAVESDTHAAADARVNLARAGLKCEVFDGRVEHWDPSGRSAIDTVIADPARGGLNQRAVSVIGASAAQQLVLVSCDAGSLGRDAFLLERSGLRFAEANLVDMFPDTSQVEVVSVFMRQGSEAAASSQPA